MANPTFGITTMMVIRSNGHKSLACLESENMELIGLEGGGQFYRLGVGVDQGQADLNAWRHRHAVVYSNSDLCRFSCQILIGGGSGYRWPVTVYMLLFSGSFE